MVNFWNDTWLRHIGPLKELVEGPSAPDETLRVYDITNASGKWD